MNNPFASAVFPIHCSCRCGTRFHMAAKAGAPETTRPPRSCAWNRPRSSFFVSGHPVAADFTSGVGASWDSGTKSMVLRVSRDFMKSISFLHRGQELSHQTTSSFSADVATRDTCLVRLTCLPCTLRILRIADSIVVFVLRLVADCKRDILVGHMTSSLTVFYLVTISPSSSNDNYMLKRVTTRAAARGRVITTLTERDIARTCNEQIANISAILPLPHPYLDAPDANSSSLREQQLHAPKVLGVRVPLLVAGVVVEAVAQQDAQGLCMSDGAPR